MESQRLIDAVPLEMLLELRREQLKGTYGDLGGAVSGALRLVQEMCLTVDPVKHGRWIDTPGKHDRVYCSRCAENCENINKIDHSGFFRFCRYCPDCGAQMDLEEPHEMD